MYVRSWPIAGARIAEIRCTLPTVKGVPQRPVWSEQFRNSYGRVVSTGARHVKTGKILGGWLQKTQSGSTSLRSARSRAVGDNRGPTGSFEAIISLKRAPAMGWQESFDFSICLHQSSRSDRPRTVGNVKPISAIRAPAIGQELSFILTSRTSLDGRKPTYRSLSPTPASMSGHCRTAANFQRTDASPQIFTTSINSQTAGTRSAAWVSATTPR